MLNAFHFKDSFLEKIETSISEKNAELLESLNGKDRDSILSSTEYIKIVFSENLLEDVQFLNSLSGSKIFKPRYADVITRDLLEQVIEFIYLMKNPEKIPDFVGANSNLPENPFDDLVESFRHLGSLRYSSKRMSVSKMTDEINEKTSSGDTQSLYDLYILLSEECHNSYFFSILDDFKEDNEISALTEYQANNLFTIISHFLKFYF